MTVSVVVADSQEQIDAAMALRTVVFVEEQLVPLAEEIDGLDDQATHLVALDGDEVVATCRLLADGTTIKLGRMVVAKERRREGIASKMLRVADQQSKLLGGEQISLAAQTYAVALYEQDGYVAYGEPFPDAGIEHIWMSKQL
ncbi:MAG: GNAT family N-acetyltransferase, partial [Actinomycetes bacterium]